MAENEAPSNVSNFERLEFVEEANNTPTLTLSGALFVSGGLWFKGYDGTYTELAVK